MGFSPKFSLLMPTFSLLEAPQTLTAPASMPLECSPTDSSESHSFGIILMPDNFRRQVARLVSYYALFK